MIDRKAENAHVKKQHDRLLKKVGMICIPIPGSRYGVFNLMNSRPAGNAAVETAAQ